MEILYFYIVFFFWLLESHCYVFKLLSKSGRDIRLYLFISFRVWLRIPQSFQILFTQFQQRCHFPSFVKYFVLKSLLLFLICVKWNLKPLSLQLFELRKDGVGIAEVLFNLFLNIDVHGWQLTLAVIVRQRTFFINRASFGGENLHVLLSRGHLSLREVRFVIGIGATSVLITQRTWPQLFEFSLVVAPCLLLRLLFGKLVIQGLETLSEIIWIILSCLVFALSPLPHGFEVLEQISRGSFAILQVPAIFHQRWH